MDQTQIMEEKQNPLMERLQIVGKLMLTIQAIMEETAIIIIIITTTETITTITIMRIITITAI